MDKSEELPPPYTEIENPPQSQNLLAGYPGAAPGQHPQGYGVPPGYVAGGYPNNGQYPPPGCGYGQPGQGYPQHFQYGANTLVVAQPMGYQVQSGPPPPDYLGSAIFVTLCCFWPTGIVAIMRASDVRNALARGDLVSARLRASSAKRMVTISIIIGICIFVLVAIVKIFGLMTQQTEFQHTT